MGKEAHEDGGCCHTCERWAGKNAPAVDRPELAIASPSALELVVTNHGTPVMTYVPDREEITVGRGKQNTIALADGTLSRRQARIFIRDGKVFVLDAGSTCGTYVDGQLTHGPTRVNDGAIISFGDHDIRITRR